MQGISIRPNIPLSPENIKIIQYFIIGLVVWFVVTGQMRKYRQAQAYSQAGSDPNTSNAIQIRQACNPSGIKMLVDMDGTWDDDLMLVADQIADVNAVNAAYVNLYGENMFERLEKELSAPKFQEWLRRAQAPQSNLPSPPFSAQVQVAAVRDTVVLRDTDSTKVAKRVKAGETVGTRLKAYNITNQQGVKTTYYLVSWTSYIFLTSQGLVKAADVKPI